MFTVALIGADGAGKTTVGRRLAEMPSLPIKYIYMGVSTQSSNVMLPTTRLVTMVKRLLGKETDMGGPPDPRCLKPVPKNPLKRSLMELKSGLKLSNRLAEEWFRQVWVWYYQHQGYIVLFDRHFFTDYYAHDIANDARTRLLTNRLHGFILSRLYPKPDLVIFLDAPPEVLLARKGEGTLELLESRRQEYLRLRDIVKNFVTVDAGQPQEEVLYQVTKAIGDFYQTRGGHSIATEPVRQEGRSS